MKFYWNTAYRQKTGHKYTPLDEFSKLGFSLSNYVYIYENMKRCLIQWWAFWSQMTSLACFFLCLDTDPSPDLYVYNWTEESGWGNDHSQDHHHVFPDGKPFPHHPGWRRCSFVYVFHTLGWTFYKTPLAASSNFNIFSHFSYSINKNANT